MFLEASYEEVDKALLKTACGKAAGSDGIGAEASEYEIRETLKGMSESKSSLVVSRVRSEWD